MFGKSTHKELETILLRLKLNAENNYRDATLEDLHELETRMNELKASGKIKEKQAAHYEELITGFKKEFKGFTHKEQKAGW